MNLSDLVPVWPVGFDRWEGTLTLLLLAAFKFDRGRILYKRTLYPDGLGYSIICWDIGFAVAALANVLFNLYPELLITIWIPRALTAAVVLLTLWQWTEVRLANQRRVEGVVSATPCPVDNATYPEVDRRVGPPDRRQVVQQ